MKLNAAQQIPKTQLTMITTIVVEKSKEPRQAASDGADAIIVLIYILCN
jgi:hypothetical protein